MDQSSFQKHPVYVTTAACCCCTIFYSLTPLQLVRCATHLLVACFNLYRCKHFHVMFNCFISLVSIFLCFVIFSIFVSFIDVLFVCILRQKWCYVNDKNFVCKKSRNILWMVHFTPIEPFMI